MSRSRGRRGRQPVYGGNITSESSQPQRHVIRGEVIDLGDIETEERPVVQATFGYLGQRFRVNPQLSEIDVMDFLDDAERLDKNDPRALLVIKEYARKHVHPDEWDRFWKAFRESGQDTNGLMSLLWKILEGVTARPTGRPSDSSAGPTATSSASPDTSSPPDADQSRREAFLRQIDRFEALGTGNGAAMAAQIAVMAESQGIDLSGEITTADLTRGPSALVAPMG